VIADAAKEVTHLGAFPLPVEIIPFGWQTTKALVEELLVGLDVLDRVGGGDGFVAGLTHALMEGRDLQTAVEWGAAHGALAMTTPGDTSMVDASEVAALVAGADARSVR